MTEAYEERKNEESLKKSTNGLPPTPGNRLKQKEMQIQMQYIQHEDQQQRVNQLVENHSNQSERTNNMINQYDDGIIFLGNYKCRMTKCNADWNAGDNTQYESRVRGIDLFKQ